jgi:hypothetical protein
MKKRTFDSIIIVLIGVSLTILAYFGLLEKSAKFMVVPMMAFYFLGQYAERKFR